MRIYIFMVNPSNFGFLQIGLSIQMSEKSWSEQN